MTIEELRKAHLAEQELEYHLIGVEHGANLLPGPGWYPALVDDIYENEDVEISFTSPDLEGIGVTVLRKNISVAFRKKEVSHVQI